MRQVNSWGQAPYSRLLLPLIGGIAGGILAGGAGLAYGIVASACFLFIFLLSHFYIRRLPFRLRHTPGVSLSLLMLALGFTAVQLSRTDSYPLFFGRYAEPESRLLVRLKEPLAEKEKSYKALAEVTGICEAGQVQPATGRLLLYFKKDSASAGLRYGDILLVANTAKRLRPPRNPGEFDYAGYMAHQQVFHSAWLNAADWVKTDKNSASAVWQHIYLMKEIFMAQIGSQVQQKRERGIAKALLLGEENELEPHITASYAGTGTLHVLSVSGMHVGILMVALRLLLKNLTRTQTGRIIRLSILLAFLWFYALLTGFSPSVARSAAMLSLILIGLDYRRITNIYNMLAASALALLLYDPFLIMQIGFQLSYAAVLGIVWLQPKLSAHWQPKIRPLKFMWEIVTGSIAAQLATFPIGLFYFNQFPLYFLFSNLVVIPISTGVLIYGCALQMLALLLPAGLLLYPGRLLDWSIWLMNEAVDRLAALPFASLEGFYITLFQCLLLYGSLFLLALATLHRSRRYLVPGLAALFVFATDILFDRYEGLSRGSMAIHAVDKAAVVSLKEGRDMYVLSDSSFLSSPEKLKFHLARFAYRSAARVQPVPFDTGAIKGQSFYFSKPFGQYGRQRFLWLSRPEDLTIAAAAPEREYEFIILSHNAKIKIHELRRRLSFRKLILMPNSSGKRCAYWEKDCAQAGIPAINLRNTATLAIEQ